jgi:hypothetical protein
LEIDMADTNTFSRESLATYEKQTPKVVPDNVPPTEKTIDAQTSEESAADDATTPSGDDSESVDQSETGDGTSDENADSSTASDEPSVDSETDGEGGEATADEEARATPPPKKGSAAARIQELNDLTEGYKLYGKQKEAQLAEAQAEIERLKKGSGTPSSKTDPAPAPQSEKEDPMPRLEDPDVNFDTDKLEVKMRKWIRSEATKAATPAAAKVIETSNLTAEQQRIATEFNGRLETFAKDHPDFEKVVLKNPILNANQLSKKASAVMVRSPLSADLMYYFGKNTDEAVRIAKLPEEEQLVEMGEIISKVKATKASGKPDSKGEKPGAGAKPAQKKSLSQAPPPPSPTKGGGRAQARDATDPGMDMDEFARQHREGKQSRRLEHQRVMRGGK